MNATVKDISRATGYSTATVSRVINDSPLVKESTKKRVQLALNELGFQPNHAARALKLNRTGMLGVIFPNLDNGFYTYVLRGVDEMASEFNMHLLTAFTHGAQDEQSLISRMIRERRADALIVMNVTLPDSFLRQVGVGELPVVLIDRPMKKGKLASVSLDNRDGASTMTRHLLDQGHREIVFVAGPAGSYDADERLFAFRRVMKARGMAVRPESIWRGDFTESSGVRLIEQHLVSGRPLPDAIFAANDAMAIGIYRILRESGRQVPRDIALAGFDDTEVARHLGLTTVQVPMQMLGREAARMALGLIEGREPARQSVLPTRLIIRTSSQSRRV